MQVVENYKRYAADAEALARRTATERERKTLLDIAETWRALAAQREQMIAKARTEPSGGHSQGQQWN